MHEPLPKTIQEHADFLREMVRLQLWFVWTWLRQHPGEDFHTAIRTRVDIFRKTDLNKGPSKNTYTAGNFTLPEWLAIETQAARLCAETPSADAFELRAWEELFRPLVEARVARDFAEGDGLENYQCGSLRYNIPRPGQKRIHFHIANRIAPRSIFADPTYLPHCMLQLMDETGRVGVTEVATGTWLNSYPKWLVLFPPEWRERLTAPDEDVGWSLSYWGQFVSARGTFNARHGQLLRQTGQLPFKCLTSWCEIPKLRAHVSHFLSQNRR